MKNNDLVFCQRYNENLLALEKAPMNGALGELIKTSVSQKAWQEWLEVQIKIINEERLDLSEELHRERLFEHMKDYLGFKKNSP